MKIGLIDVDSHNFPNLALMKISAYHKMLGDDVFMYMPLFHNNCDKIYISKIFTFTPDIQYFHCDNIEKGGSGYNIEIKLPSEIDNIYPDYSLYNITDTAYGYLTRGCFRECDFCIVPKKEGKYSIQKYTLNQFYKNQKYIKLLDPNITASPNCIDLFNELAETKSFVDFTQGLDLRLLTDQKIEAIKNIKLQRIHFAWDKIEDEKIICERLTTFMKYSSFNHRNTFVYVLVNWNTTFDQDLYRVYKLINIGVTPFIMIYEKEKADKKYYALQRYVNAVPIFRSIKSFEEYKK